ncbi:MAG TPA: hypothetical protein PKH10_05235 [bacterium]|nr:hypothetical protein [bacterium]
MNRWHLLVIGGLFLIVTGVVLVDIHRLRGEIARNREVIEKLTMERSAAQQRMRELELRIERMKSDRQTREMTALRRYKMLRPDQYILHDAVD